MEEWTNSESDLQEAHGEDDSESNQENETLQRGIQAIPGLGLFDPSAARMSLRSTTPSKPREMDTETPAENNGKHGRGSVSSLQLRV